VTPRRGKVLIVGFDGLDYELFKRRSRLRCQLHPLLAPIPVTGPSWTSIYTGDSMARHNVRDVFGLEFRRRYSDNHVLHMLRWHVHNLGLMLRLKPPRRRHVTYQTTRSKYLWDTLGRAGITVKTVNMPVACPPREVNGVQVSGFPVIRRKPLCYPPALAERIPADYPQLSDMIQWFSDPERDSHSHWRRCLRRMGPEPAMARVVDDGERLVRLFLELPAADVEMVQFSFIDRLGHVFGISGRIEEFCYDLVDTLTRELVEGSRPATTVVISDHGFQGEEHTDLGCLAIDGQLQPAVKVPDGYTPSVLDVAPTLAGFFGLSHPCEGNDLTAAGHYVTRSLEEEQREKEKLMQHLADLGYL